MKKIEMQTHGRESYLYALSSLLERASYYGIRSLIVLFMMGELINMESNEALEIYGWFTGIVIFAKIFGALIGDLWIGSRKAIIIGAILQSIGAFSFCSGSTTGLYIGLLLISLGSGLYSPNINAEFGRNYLPKPKLMDAGFNMNYLAINLGAFLGALIIGTSGETLGWYEGFIIAGIVQLIAIVPIYMIKGQEPIESKEEEKSNKQKIKPIALAIGMVGVFWLTYEFANAQIFQTQHQLSQLSILNIPNSLWYSANTFFFIPLSLLAFFFWTKYYSSQFFKLMIGFLIATLSFGVLILIPESPEAPFALLFLIAILLLNLSEIYITPVVQSTLTKFTNTKYLAIWMSLAFIPNRILIYPLSYVYGNAYEDPSKALVVALGITATAGIILFVLYKKKKLEFRGNH